MSSLNYLSLFSGIGGFERGIEQALADHRPDRSETTRPDSVSHAGAIPLPEGRVGRTACVGFSEIDPRATAIYQRHFPGHESLGDITRIDANAVPDFDLLCGGFPCQSFSIVGNRQGLHDPRGALFFDIARIVAAKRPRFLLLENVRGFLSDAGGDTARTCFALLHELGYDCQWQVLNSKNFGVPQNRERVFIVGHRRGEPRPEIFPFLRQAERTAQADQGALLDQSEPHAIRRLTPLEYERLQGFPDGWTDGVADTYRYRCLANSVYPVIIRTIMGRLLWSTRTR